MSCDLAKTIPAEIEIFQLKNDLVEARCEANFWKSQHSRAKQREEELKNQVEDLKAKLSLRERQLFGKKSEKEAHPKNPVQKKPRRKRGQQEGSKGHGRKSHSHFEERDEWIEIPPDCRNCSKCKQPYQETSLTEDSKIIEIEVAAHLRKIHRKRYKKTCQCDTPTFITAPVAPKVLSKSIFGNSLWSHLIIEKYQFGQPLNRIIKNLKSYELDISASTIIEGFNRLQSILKPVYEKIQEKNRLESHWNIDETRWKVFEAIDEKIGNTWWLWVFKSSETVLFTLEPSRSSKALDKHFVRNSPSGVISCDRYGAYSCFAKKHENISLSFCWAHVRRDFLQLAKDKPQHQEWALEWVKRIGKIFHINKQKMQLQSNPEELLKCDKKLKRYVNQVEKIKNQQLDDISVPEPCLKLLKSLKKHWKGLVVFLNYRMDMDNNAAERALRNPVVGRKNYYGSGSCESGEFTVISFSIIQTLLVWKINPRSWFEWVFDMSAKNKEVCVDLFLPWNMEEHQKNKLSFVETFANFS